MQENFENQGYTSSFITAFVKGLAIDNSKIKCLTAEMLTAKELSPSLEAVEIAICPNINSIQMFGSCESTSFRVTPGDILRSNILSCVNAVKKYTSEKLPSLIVFILHLYGHSFAAIAYHGRTVYYLNLTGNEKYDSFILIPFSFFISKNALSNNEKLNLVQLKNNRIIQNYEQDSGMLVCAFLEKMLEKCRNPSAIIKEDQLISDLNLASINRLTIQQHQNELVETYNNLMSLQNQTSETMVTFFSGTSLSVKSVQSQNPVSSTYYPETTTSESKPYDNMAITYPVLNTQPVPETLLPPLTQNIPAYNPLYPLPNYNFIYQQQPSYTPLFQSPNNGIYINQKIQQPPQPSKSLQSPQPNVRNNSVISRKNDRFIATNSTKPAAASNSEAGNYYCADCKEILSAPHCMKAIKMKIIHEIKWLCGPCHKELKLQSRESHELTEGHRSKEKIFKDAAMKKLISETPYSNTSQISNNTAQIDNHVKIAANPPSTVNVDKAIDGSNSNAKSNSSSNSNSNSSSNSYDLSKGMFIEKRQVKALLIKKCATTYFLLIKLLQEFFAPYKRKDIEQIITDQEFLASKFDQINQIIASFLEWLNMSHDTTVPFLTSPQIFNDVKMTVMQFTSLSAGAYKAIEALWNKGGNINNLIFTPWNNQEMKPKIEHILKLLSAISYYYKDFYNYLKKTAHNDWPELTVLQTNSAGLPIEFFENYENPTLSNAEKKPSNVVVVNPPSVKVIENLKESLNSAHQTASTSAGTQDSSKKRKHHTSSSKVRTYPAQKRPHTNESMSPTKNDKDSSNVQKVRRFFSQLQTTNELDPILSENIAIANQKITESQDVVPPTESLPVLSENPPINDESVLLLNEYLTVPNQSFPVLNENSPVHEDSLLVLNENSPVQKNSLPVLNEDVVVHKEMLPVLNENPPVHKEMLPVLNENPPVHKESPPIFNEDLVVQNGSLAVLNEDPPVYKESIPILIENIPTSSQSDAAQNMDLVPRHDSVQDLNDEIQTESEEVTQSTSSGEQIAPQELMEANHANDHDNSQIQAMDLSEKNSDLALTTEETLEKETTANSSDDDAKNAQPISQQSTDVTVTQSSIVENNFFSRYLSKLQGNNVGNQNGEESQKNLKTNSTNNYSPTLFSTPPSSFLQAKTEAEDHKTKDKADEKASTKAEETISNQMTASSPPTADKLNTNDNLDEDLYQDNTIQALLKIAFKDMKNLNIITSERHILSKDKTNIKIIPAQCPNLSDQLKEMFLNVLCTAIKDANKNNITTLIPFNTARKVKVSKNGSESSGEHWIALSIKPYKEGVTIKFIDPLGSVEKWTLVQFSERESGWCGEKIEKDFLIKNALYTLTTYDRELTLNGNASSFVELIKNGQVNKRVKKELKIGSKIQILFTGIQQQNNEIDCGPFIVEDLTEEGLGKELSKPSAASLREKHKKMLAEQIVDTEHQTSTTQLSMNH